MKLGFCVSYFNHPFIYFQRLFMKKKSRGRVKNIMGIDQELVLKDEANMVNDAANHYKVLE